MDELITQTTAKMQKVLLLIKEDLATVRVGRATSSLVENIPIKAYGGTQAFKVIELGTIAIQDVHTLTITAFDASIANDMQKGILEANLGFNPVITATGTITISIPELSQERREQLFKLIRQKLESGKVMIRQSRHEAMIELKKKYNDKLISEDELGRLEKEIQKVTDKIAGEVETIGKQKEDELMRL